MSEIRTVSRTVPIHQGAKPLPSLDKKRPFPSKQNPLPSSFHPAIPKSTTIWSTAGTKYAQAPKNPSSLSKTKPAWNRQSVSKPGSEKMPPTKPRLPQIRAAKKIPVNMKLIVNLAKLEMHFGDAQRKDVFPGHQDSSFQTFFLSDALLIRTREWEHRGTRSVISFNFRETDKNEKHIHAITFFRLDKIKNFISDLKKIDPLLASYLEKRVISKIPTLSSSKEEVTIPISPSHPLVLDVSKSADMIMNHDVKSGKKNSAYLKAFWSRIPKIQPHSFPNIPHNNITQITMSEFAVTGPRTKNRFISTFALNPCIGLVVVDPVRKVSALVHLTAMNDIINSAII